MTVRYAILAKSIEPPGPKLMEQAFRGVPGLTAADAAIVCQGISGVLVRGFGADQALVLENNLKAQGIECEIVEESGLPALAPAQKLRSVEFQSDTLLLNGGSAGESAVRWEQLGLIAAGSVQQAEFQRTRREWVEVRHSHIHVHAGIIIPIVTRETKSEYRSREHDEWVLRAEIIEAGWTKRYLIEAEDFDYSCLGALASESLSTKFCLLLREFAARAPGALLNRGAAAILEEPCRLVYYYRTAAFMNETIWMLWDANGARR